MIGICWHLVTKKNNIGCWVASNMEKWLCSHMNDNLTQIILHLITFFSRNQSLFPNHKLHATLCIKSEHFHKHLTLYVLLANNFWHVLLNAPSMLLGTWQGQNMNWTSRFPRYVKQIELWRSIWIKKLCYNCFTS